MAQTNMNIRIDEADKRAFDEVCDKLGMSMSTAFNIFAKTVIRQQRIPFEISLDRPNAETLQAIDDVNNGRNLSGPYRSMQELREALDA
jgi:DNA-damage-inducible protein J